MSVIFAKLGSFLQTVIIKIRFFTISAGHDIQKKDMITL